MILALMRNWVEIEGREMSNSAILSSFAKLHILQNDEAELWDFAEQVIWWLCAVAEKTGGFGEGCEQLKLAVFDQFRARHGMVRPHKILWSKSCEFRWISTKTCVKITILMILSILRVACNFAEKCKNSLFRVFVTRHPLLKFCTQVHENEIHEL